jgi:hypothetical protein
MDIVGIESFMALIRRAVVDEEGSGIRSDYQVLAEVWAESSQSRQVFDHL